MALKFQLTDIPTETGRPKLPNPMMPVAQAAVEARAKGKAVIFEPDLGDGDGQYSIDYVERKLRECGAELNVTISIRRQDPEGKKLTVFAKDRIERKRKTVTPEQAAAALEKKTGDAS